MAEIPVVTLYVVIKPAKNNHPTTSNLKEYNEQDCLCRCIFSYDMSEFNTQASDVFYH